MFNKIISKIKKILLWLWNECRDRKTLTLLLIVIAVVYLPVWGGYLLYWITEWNWSLVLASTCAVFWAGPLTPFFPFCVTITLSIKKFIRIRRRRKANKKG